MRNYVIYKEVPGMEPAYLKADGDFSYDPKDAKIHKVKTWLEFIVKILNILITIFGTDLKYKQIKHN